MSFPIDIINFFLFLVHASFLTNNINSVGTKFGHLGKHKEENKTKNAVPWMSPSLQKPWVALPALEQLAELCMTLTSFYLVSNRP